MEIIATLEKPYTEQERVNFIVPYINGYTIKYTDEAVEIWDYTDAEQLALAKQKKYKEANEGAKFFLESGEALFEFEEGKHIEATDGNIAKLTAYALAYVTGQLEPTELVVWNTKEDETVELNAEQVAFIVKGLGFVQASVWSVQFPQYVQLIEEAETLEEVEAIEINYYSEEPVSKEK